MGQQFTSIAKGLNMGSFVESKEEFLEKGKKAQIGEIREWHGQKFQKQPNGGWIPVKQGTKDSKKEFDWKKVTVEDIKGLPTGTKISFMDELSGESVIAEKAGDNSWKGGDGNTYSDEEMAESVSHPDAHDHKIEKPAAKKEGKSSEVRRDLPKMEHGGDEKKETSGVDREKLMSIISEQLKNMSPEEVERIKKIFSSEPKPGTGDANSNKKDSVSLEDAQKGDTLIDHNGDEWTVMASPLDDFKIVEKFDNGSMKEMIEEEGLQGPFIPVKDKSGHTAVYAVDETRDLKIVKK